MKRLKSIDLLNFELFLAKRLIGSKVYKNSVSAPIIKIGVTAIAIGMIVMLIAVATNLGLQHKIREKVVAFNGYATISNFDANNSKESSTPISTKQDFYPVFKAVPEVTHIQAVATKFGVIRTATDFEGVILKGVGGDYDWSYFKSFLVEGHVPDYTGSRNETILVSETLANRLNFKLGDTFNTYFIKEDSSKPPNIIPYTIVGIFNSGFEELDKTYIIGDIRHIQRLNRWQADEIGQFEVFFNSFDALDELGLKVFENTPSTLNTEIVSNKFFAIFEWIKIFDKNSYGIIIIMIIVAGINMITALLVLILERTQMIGVLKALGSSNWSIRKLFLYNATYLVVLGLFWGNLIGLALLGIQKTAKLFPLDPSVYYVTEVPVYLHWGFIVLLNVGTLLLCVAMLLIPSHIITKITPIKAIRFE